MAAQSPGGPTAGGEKFKGVSALTRLQFGEVILPEEAASHDHREQEEAAGGREEPLLFYCQPAASLGWGGHKSLGVSQREEREGPCPGPSYALASPRHHGSP